MRGLDRLIEIRRSGRKPERMTVSLPGMGFPSGIVCEGEVACNGDDRPTSVDLRAFVGLQVVVMAAVDQFDEAEQWGKALVRAGARDVGLVFGMPRETWIEGPFWMHINGENRWQ